MHSDNTTSKEPREIQNRTQQLNPEAAPWIPSDVLLTRKSQHHYIPEIFLDSGVVQNVNQTKFRNNQLRKHRFKETDKRGKKTVDQCYNVGRQSDRASGFSGNQQINISNRRRQSSRLSSGAKCNVMQPFSGETKPKVTNFDCLKEDSNRKLPTINSSFEISSDCISFPALSCCSVHTQVPFVPQVNYGKLISSVASTPISDLPIAQRTPREDELFNIKHLDILKRHVLRGVNEVNENTIENQMEVLNHPNSLNLNNKFVHQANENNEEYKQSHEAASKLRPDHLSHRKSAFQPVQYTEAMKLKWRKRWFTLTSERLAAIQKQQKELDFMRIEDKKFTDNGIFQSSITSMNGNSSESESLDIQQDENENKSIPCELKLFSSDELKIFKNDKSSETDHPVATPESWASALFSGSTNEVTIQIKGGACWDWKIEQVHFEFAKTFLYNNTAIKNFTALHVCSILGDPVLLRLVLDMSGIIGLSARDLCKATPLHYAAAHVKTLKRLNDNAAECVNILLQCGSRINAKDIKGNTPLHVAVLNGNFSAVQAICSRSETKIDIQNKNRETSLLLAVQLQSSEIVSILLKYGAKVDIPNCSGRTPLCAASVNGNIEILENLLFSRQFRRTRGNDVLKQKAEVPPICKDVNKSNILKASMKKYINEPVALSALHEASYFGISESIAILLDYGFDPCIKESKAGNTALGCALAGKGGPHIECIRIILEYSGDTLLNIPNSLNINPIILAIRNSSDNPEVVATLLKFCKDPTSVLNATCGIRGNLTPLKEALLEKKVNITVALLQAGATLKLGELDQIHLNTSQVTLESPIFSPYSRHIRDLLITSSAMDLCSTSDVTIIFRDGSEMYCHNPILSLASAYFAAEISSSKENSSCVVILDDFPTKTVRRVLYCIYAGALVFPEKEARSPCTDELMDMLSASVRYKCHALKIQLQHAIIQWDSNIGSFVSKLLPLAKHLQAHVLEQYCLQNLQVCKMNQYKVFATGSCSRMTFPDDQPCSEWLHKHMPSFPFTSQLVGYRLRDLMPILMDPSRCQNLCINREQRTHMYRQVVSGAENMEEIPTEVALGGHFSRLLSSGDYSDVTIQIDGTDFQVHACFLAARSEKFRAMLRFQNMKSRMKNSCATTNLKLNLSCDISNPFIFGEFLYFIYSGFLRPDLSMDALIELAILADEFLVTDLIDQVERLFVDSLKFGCLDLSGEAISVIDLFKLGDMLSRPFLTRKAAEHILVDFQCIIHSQAFAESGLLPTDIVKIILAEL